MIEAMEQKIITNIKGPFLKNEKLRKEINFDITAEALRMICSSRSSFYPLFDLLKVEYNKKYLDELLNKIFDVFDFVTAECINEIVKSYKNPDIKDSKKKEYYINQVPIIKEDLLKIKDTICKMTLDKLLIFHNIIRG